MNGCTIDGTISHVIFQNEENGYTVLRLVDRKSTRLNSSH